MYTCAKDNVHTIRMKRFEICIHFFSCHVSLQTIDSYHVTVKKLILLRVFITSPDVGGGGQKGGEEELEGNYDIMLHVKKCTIVILSCQGSLANAKFLVGLKDF